MAFIGPAGPGSPSRPVSGHRRWSTPGHQLRFGRLERPLGHLRPLAFGRDLFARGCRFAPCHVPRGLRLAPRPSSARWAAASALRIASWSPASSPSRRAAWTRSSAAAWASCSARASAARMAFSASCCTLASVATGTVAGDRPGATGAICRRWRLQPCRRDTHPGQAIVPGFLVPAMARRQPLGGGGGDAPGLAQLGVGQGAGVIGGGHGDSLRHTEKAYPVTLALVPGDFSVTRSCPLRHGGLDWRRRSGLRQCSIPDKRSAV
jgi:hypothetical protein